MLLAHDLAARLEDLVASDFNKTKKALSGAHQDYVSRVSSEDMALSLHTAVLLQLLCRLFSPGSVLDLGSGFSSYVLRLVQAQGAPDMQLVSVDTDPQWLERSREYVREQGLAADGFMLWDAIEDRHFDLILLDVERPPQRNGYLARTLQRFCKPQTALLLDDLHMPSYRLYALEALMQYNYCHLDCRRYTLDRFGRYASLFLGLT